MEQLPRLRGIYVFADVSCSGRTAPDVRKPPERSRRSLSRVRSVSSGRGCRTQWRGADTDV